MEVWLWVAHAFKREGTVFLAVLAVLLCMVLFSLGTERVVNEFYEDDQYFSNNAWPKAVAFSIPGFLFLLVGLAQVFSKSTELKTGEEVEAGPLCCLIGATLFLFALLFVCLS